jgi:hypothetical protein
MKKKTQPLGKRSVQRYVDKVLWNRIKGFQDPIKEEMKKELWNNISNKEAYTEVFDVKEAGHRLLIEYTIEDKEALDVTTKNSTKTEILYEEKRNFFFL